MTPTNHPKTQRKPLGKRLLPWLILVLILFIVGLVVGILQPGTTPESPPPAMETATPTTREVILYFASSDGQTLVAETRLINECEREEDCLRDTVQALIDGPQGDLVAILPQRASLRELTVADSLARIDFSQDLVAAHPGGTQSELLTVYGLVDTLTVNFPHLRQVQILVEGVAVPTLKGHVDLRQPVYPDFSLVEEGAAPVGRMESLPSGGSE